MTGPKVLVPAPAQSSARAPLPPAPDFGWLLLGSLGLVFTVVGGTDVLLTWVPVRFGNPEWEFGTVTSSLDGLPLVTMGLVLMLAAGTARGMRWVVRTVALVMVVLAVAIALAAVLYA